ncbi:hypothetical protein HN51_018637 [Arachis hypogaea]
MSKPTASPVALVVPNPSAAGFMASRKAIITTGAALGRGAAATGFIHFLALTEASKYRKDGPFRKYITGVFINSVALRIHINYVNKS